MKLLTGKRALVTGIASNRSIAWGIAKSLAENGADLALSYSSERLLSRAQKCAKECNSDFVLECDASDDESIANMFTSIAKRWDSLDILVHSIAFASKEELEGDFVDVTTRQGFATAHDISAYSLVALSKAARPLMKDRNGSILTLSYIGAERAIVNYNVMGAAKASLEACVRYSAASLGADGIRVNAISAGPLQTLAAAGISGFRTMLDFNRQVCPLKRDLTTKDIGDVATFLCSDLSQCITGITLHADNGYHCIGVVANSA